MSKKFGGKKHANDWRGVKVRLTRRLRNGMGEVPAGLIGRIHDSPIMNGKIHFTGEPCSCCGAQFRVYGLEYQDFEEVT